MRIPDLYVLAVWLSTADPVHDLLIPLAPSFPRLQANRVSVADEFDRALAPLALQKMIAADGRPT